jgi:hypothetical protein
MPNQTEPSYHPTPADPDQDGPSSVVVRDEGIEVIPATTSTTPEPESQSSETFISILQEFWKIPDAGCPITK